MKFDFHRFLEVVKFVGPAVLAATPGAQRIPLDMIPTIVDAIGEAQAIKGASGSDRKAHVMKVIDGAVHVSNETGKVKLDAGEIKTVAGAGIDNVIATVKIIHGAKVVDPGSAPSTLATGDGHATHGHGSADNLPPAPPSPAVDAALQASDPPPSDAFDGGAIRPPAATT